jgi:hypothetical protein
MRIVVSLTSWNKRIGQAKHTIDSMLHQTRKPDAIYLNLDLDNFPNSFNSIPDWINEYNAKYSNFHVNFRLHDLKVWQKIMPTIKEYDTSSDYILVTLDDDVTYPSKYLEEVEANMQCCDWLCTKSNQHTMRAIYGIWT